MLVEVLEERATCVCQPKEYPFPYEFINDLADKPSELKITETTVDDKGQERRRSSIWSANGDGGRRASIVGSLTGIFRRGSTARGSAVEDEKE